jgi:hypothetical protein
MGRIAGALTDRSAPTKMGKSTRWTHQVVARIFKRGYRARADIPGAVGRNDDAITPNAA